MSDDEWGAGVSPLIGIKDKTDGQEKRLYKDQRCQRA